MTESESIPASSSGFSAKQKLFALAAVVLILAVCLSLYWLLVARFWESTDDAYVEADMANLAPKISGYVERVMVDDNQPVKEGDPLLQLKQDDYLAQLEKAQAALQQQQAAIKTLDSEITLQDSLIQKAESAVASAQAEFDRTYLDRKRFTDLQKTGAVSRQQFDKAVAVSDQAKAALEEAQAGLKAEQQRITVYRDQRHQTDAALQEAQAEVALAQLNLDNTLLRAPMDGVVGNKHVQVGQYLIPGVQVMAVVPLDHVYVTANFKETQVDAMRIGQPVKLSVDALPDKELQGVVESFSPASGSRFSLLPPENATGNFTKIVQRIPVRIRVSDLDGVEGQLRPGMSVEVSVNINAKPQPQMAKANSQAGY